MIRRPGVTYTEGEPLRTVDHNRVVGSSMDIAQAWPAEHGPTGQHDAPRFEKGGFVFSEIVGDVVSSSGIASVTEVSGGEMRVELEESFASPDHWGLMVRVKGTGSSPLRDVIYPEIADMRKTGSVGYIKLSPILIPDGTATVIVVGFRRRLTADRYEAPIGSKLVPVRETAHPSGVGDVVSVEQLNGVVAFADDLADAVEREHQAVHDGPYRHANPQFAAASACVEFTLTGDDTESILSSQRIAWHEGFAVGGAPRLVLDPVPVPARPDTRDDEPVLLRSTGVYLEWMLPTDDEQWPDVGYALAEMAPSYSRLWHASQRGATGRLFLCEIESVDDGPYAPVDVFDAGLADMHRIYLMIRTRAEE